VDIVFQNEVISNVFDVVYNITQVAALEAGAELKQFIKVHGKGFRGSLDTR
jgi:hypothetical protein